jgi:arginyl-tRNA synthetase
MIEDKIKNEIISRLEILFPGINISAKEIDVSRSDNPDFGDYSTNIAFKIAKQLKTNPEKIAISLAQDLAGWNRAIKAEAKSGFVNIFLEKELFHEILKQILDEKDHYGNSDLLKGQKIQIEFISANPTGPLTLANGRGGFGGDVLANVLAKNGAKIEREYLVNDGGNQVKILGDSILAVCGLAGKNDELYQGEYIEEWAKNHTEECQKNKTEPQKLGYLAAKDILESMIKPSIEKMKIEFDNWFSEKELKESSEIEQAIESLTKKGLTYERDNALWLKTTQFGDDKDRVIIKSDGSYTYLAPDIAYHWDKLYKRKFDKVINLWGADHHGYVGRMMAATEAMGFKDQLDVIIMQMVRLIQKGKEIRMSKRKGTYITMDDLLGMIGGVDSSDVARFFFLSRSFNTHMDFDLDAAKEKSEKNPVFYVKYAFARLSGILKNAQGLSLPEANLSKLIAPEEIELIDELSQLESVIRSIIMFGDYPVHFLTFYVQDIATKFHAFYDKCRVIDENNLELSVARLELVKATQIVLRIVMEDLIGIEAPERM